MLRTQLEASWATLRERNWRNAPFRQRTSRPTRNSPKQSVLNGSRSLDKLATRPRLIAWNVNSVCPQSRRSLAFPTVVLQQAEDRENYTATAFRRSFTVESGLSHRRRWATRAMEPG